MEAGRLRDLVQVAPTSCQACCVKEDDHLWDLSNFSSSHRPDMFLSYTALSVVAAPPSAAKLIRCATAPTTPGCTFPPPPETFDVRFDFGGNNVTFRVTTAWSPPYASLFHQLVSLGYYDETPPFRVDYRNSSYSFMAQMGWNLLPGVQAA